MVGLLSFFLWVEEWGRGTRSPSISVFIFCAEVLGNAAGKDKIVQLSQYADDTPMILDGSELVSSFRT